MVSTVPGREYEENTLATRLTDVEWLAQCGAAHHDVAQTQHVHAHRPHVRSAADDGDEGEAQRVGAAVLGHFEPMASAMSERAVVDEHARAAGPHHGRAGPHHCPGRLHRTAGTTQGDIDCIVIDRLLLRVGRRLPARGPKNLGKLVIRRQRPEFNARAIVQHQGFARQPKFRWQPLDKLPRMPPRARNAQVHDNRSGYFTHPMRLIRGSLRRSSSLSSR